MSAPARSSQPSRKTKSAWRKNINLTDITTGLQSARDEARITGKGTLADADANILFQTDVAGDVGVKRKSEKEHGTLRVDEILAQRSAVPAVSAKKRNHEDSKTTDGVARKKVKKNGVSHAEYERLRQVAYGGQASSTALTTTTNDGDGSYGDTQLELHDPWAITPAPAPQAPDAWLPTPFVKNAPGTLTHAPIALTANGKAPSHVPRPGKSSSYNPDFSSWSASLASAGEAEIETEKLRRAAALKETEREARVEAAGAEADRLAAAAEASGAETDGLSEFESEWEGFASEAEERRKASAKRPTRKTVAERNKVKRRKEIEAKEKHDSRSKARDGQVKRMEAITREMRAKGISEKEASKTIAKVDSGIEASSSSDENGGVPVQLRKARFGQRVIPDAPLETKLPDELEDSLRRLKPEGNLLNDRFRNMIVQGRVEARPKPIGQQRLKRVKVTEKWGHKDWKLE